MADALLTPDKAAVIEIAVLNQFLHVFQDTAAAVAAMTKELADMADALLPGEETAKSTKPSAPLRQRLQQSWQGKVGLSQHIIGDRSY